MYHLIVRAMGGFTDDDPYARVVNLRFENVYKYPNRTKSGHRSKDHTAVDVHALIRHRHVYQGHQCEFVIGTFFLRENGEVSPINTNGHVAITEDDIKILGFRGGRYKEENFDKKTCKDWCWDSIAEWVRGNTSPMETRPFEDPEADGIPALVGGE